MKWTTPADIKKQVQKLWDKGKLLSILVEGNALFPYRAAFKTPVTAELSSEFAEVRKWIDTLRKSEGKGYRIVWREVHHRVIGRNALPEGIWIDTLDAALIWIEKTKDAQKFKQIVDETGRRNPALLPWLARQPLLALSLWEIWTKFLDVVDWIQHHPRPGIYLREVDIPGIDSKFIEIYRRILTELLDLVLQPEVIQPDAPGVTGFCRRYGFREKPLRIRFRILDPERFIFPSEDQDITVTDKTFARLNPPIQNIFITENEINFLAFPAIPDSMIIFGAGYGFEALAEARWLQERRIYYWGDIDTHGFAILDQLRASLPHAESLLMDRDTLLYHRQFWVTESDPQKRDLSRLTDSESRLYDDLRYNRIDKQIRLEQERVCYSWVQCALQRIELDTSIVRVVPPAD